MGTVATRWAAVRMLVAPVGDESVVAVGGPGWGFVPPIHHAGRAAPAGATRPWSVLMSFCDVGNGVPEARGDRV